MASETICDFYTLPGPLTEPGLHGHCLDALPRDVAALCEVVQGLVIHFGWAHHYGVTLSDERRREANLRSVSAILARALELDGRGLVHARPPEQRVVGCCRDFTVLLCAILRHQGVPARARCGFGAYFLSGQFEDHWVCEYWHSGQQRWMRVDAQLDAIQREALRLPFDPLDVPADQFLDAGRAWQMCRSGAADPARFGIFDMRGRWFIRGNVVRDLAALNRMELLPWDGWGLMERLGPTDGDSAQDLALVDRIATLTQHPDESFDELRRLYESDANLRVPDAVRNFQTGAMESITLAR